MVSNIKIHSMSQYNEKFLSKCTKTKMALYPELYSLKYSIKYSVQYSVKLSVRYSLKYSLK